MRTALLKLDLKKKGMENMEENLISIIIPVFNVESYLEQCVESVLNQTYRNIEVLLVDDGSADRSGEICDRFAEKDSRVKVFHQPNQGTAVARNVGIANAKGDYAAFVDGDDWIEADMYEKLLQHMADVDLVCCGCIDENPKERGSEKSVVLDAYSEGKKQEEDFRNILKTMIYDIESGRIFSLCPTLWGKLFRMKILKDVEREDAVGVPYGQDGILFWRYMLLIDSMYVSHRGLYHYRIREGSTTRRIERNQLSNLNKLYTRLLKTFEKQNKEYHLIPQLESFIRIQCNIAMDSRMGFSSNLVFTDFVADTGGLCGKRIVVYGAGKCGQDMMRQFLYFGYEVVLWVDKNYQNCRVQNIDMEVNSVQKIKEVEFDLIWIAISSEKVVNEVKTELVEKGISAEQIVWKKPMRLY